VKIAFDENVPLGMARVFQSLANERPLRRHMGGFIVVCAQDYAPKPSDPDYQAKSDVPWLTRYAADGGRVVISGDCGMLEKPHELLALKQNGFILVLFERSWSNWDFFKKSSLLLHYWVALSKRVKSSKRGSLWRIPGHWKDNEDLRRIIVKQSKLKRGTPSITVQKPREVVGKGKSPGRPSPAISPGSKSSRVETDTRAKPAQGELNLNFSSKANRDDSPK
jgi:hypothetical protein